MSETLDIQILKHMTDALNKCLNTNKTFRARPHHCWASVTVPNLTRRQTTPQNKKTKMLCRPTPSFKVSRERREPWASKVDANAQTSCELVLLPLRRRAFLLCGIVATLGAYARVQAEGAFHL